MNYRNLLEILIERSEIVTETGCHIWLDKIDKNGYGYYTGQKILFNKILIGGRKGIGETSAHRISYIIYSKTSIPQDKYVCHKCDTKSCINPKHLFLGTPSENAKDYISKFGAPKSRTFKNYSTGNTYDSDYFRKKFPL